MNKARIGRAGVVLIALIAAGCVVSVVVWFLRETKQTVDVTPIQNQEISQQNPEVEQQPEQETAQKIDEVALQKVVDEWIAGQSSSVDASIVVANSNGIVLASHDSDKAYFTASIYKLFVAYEGYRAVDNGLLRASDNALSSRSVGECLDLMIRESDSPCGERLWADLGKSTIDDALETYNIIDTDMVGLQTTAADAANMLARIARGEALSEASQTAFLDSMREQPALYRRGLPSGFSDKVTVYNKVGWNEQLEWHDAAIIERSDGERFVVVVLTSSVGSKKIVELAQKLEGVFLTEAR